MPEHVIEGFDAAFQSLGAAMTTAARQLNELNAILIEHRERWLATERGQWPDEFTLLNRYVRTGYEPPFIFND